MVTDNVGTSKTSSLLILRATLNKIKMKNEKRIDNAEKIKALTWCTFFCACWCVYEENASCT